MRSYRLTGKGKKIARLPNAARDDILDHLYPNKTADIEELKIVEGPNTVLSRLQDLVRRGLIEEVEQNSL
jgi:hypothetical protein